MSARARRRQWSLGLAFVSPWLVGFAVFGLYPLVMAVYYSFTNYDVLRSPVWVGGLNYRDMLGDEVFWQSLRNTLLYASAAVPLSLTLSLLVAVLLNRPVFGRGLLRTCVYLPTIMPLVALSMVWLWLFNGDIGLVNHVMRSLGIEGPQWIGDPAWSKPVLVLASVWQIGGSMVLFLAGLQEVPRSLYEAAEIDGAGRLRQFFRTIPSELSEAARIDGCSELRIFLQIILPLARPALVVVALFQLLTTWNDFLGPLIDLTDQSDFTLALGLQFFQSQHGGTPWHLLMAASTLIVTPVILLFFLAQRAFVEGVSTTGLKG